MRWKGIIGGGVTGGLLAAAAGLVVLGDAFSDSAATFVVIGIVTGTIIGDMIVARDRPSAHPAQNRDAPIEHAKAMIHQAAAEIDSASA